MRRYRNDLLLIGLSLFAYFCWMSQALSPWIALGFYPIIFLGLKLKKAPINDYLIVTFFSSISTNHHLPFEIDMVLVGILFIVTLYQNFIHHRFNRGRLFWILLINLLYTLIGITWTFVLKDGYDGFCALTEGYLIYFVMTNQKVQVKQEDFIHFSKAATFLLLTITAELGTVYAKVGYTHLIQFKDLLDLGWGFSNTLAIFYVFFLPLAFYKYKYHFQYSVFLLLDLINGIGLIMTLSRGAYLGIIVSILLFLICNIRRSFIYKYSLPALIVLVGGLYGAQFIPMFRLIKEKLIDHFLYDSQRYSLYQLAIKSFINHPIFGNGTKSSKYIINHYTDLGNTFFHNFILQVIATLGIVGGLLLILVLIQSLRVLIDFNHPFVMALSFGIVGEWVHQLFDISFDHYYFGLIMYSFIGIAEWIHMRKKIGSDKNGFKRTQFR